MFLQYFKLAEQPFPSTPDPRFLFQSHSHREALASLYCGFHANRGFTVLIAEPGMGKTTLLFQFLDHIRDRARTVFLFNTLFTATDLLSFILRDLGVNPHATLPDQHRQLNEVLAAEACAGRRVVLVIDEAQNLSPEALEALRLLTNFETPRSKLLQVVLAGQPQLADKLARPELAQLLQRVSTICRLTPFTHEETAAYIEHRLKLAGYTQGPLFTSSAMRTLAEASGGTPRVIHTLCFNALCLCRARGTSVVDDSIAREAIMDAQLPVTKRTVTKVLRKVAAPLFENRMQFHPVLLISRIPSRRFAQVLLGAVVLLIGLPLFSIQLSGWPLTPLASLKPMYQVEASTEKAAPHSVPLAASVTTADPIHQKLPQPGEVDSEHSSGPIRVTVAPGDTLQQIAIRHLGRFDETILRRILALNPQLEDPDYLESGRTILLPGPSTETASVSARSTQ